MRAQFRYKRRRRQPYYLTIFTGVQVERVDNRSAPLPKPPFIPGDEEVVHERRSPKAPSYVQMPSDYDSDRDIRDAFKCQNTVFHRQLNSFLTEFRQNCPDDGGAMQEAIATILAKGLSDLSKTIHEVQVLGCQCFQPCCRKANDKNAKNSKSRTHRLHSTRSDANNDKASSSSDLNHGERLSDDDSPIYRSRGRLKRPLYGIRDIFPSDSEDTASEEPPPPNEDPPALLRRREVEELCLSPSYSPMRKRLRESQGTPPYPETQSLAMDVIVPIEEPTRLEVGVQATLVKDVRNEGVQVEVTKEAVEKGVQTEKEFADASTQYEEETNEVATHALDADVSTKDEEETDEVATQVLEMDVVMTSLEPVTVDEGTQSNFESESGTFTLVRGGTPKKLKTSGSQVPSDPLPEEEAPEPGIWVEAKKTRDEPESQDEMEETLIVPVGRPSGSDGSLSFTSAIPAQACPESQVESISSTASFASAEKDDPWASVNEDLISESDSSSPGSSKMDTTLANLAAIEESLESSLGTWVLTGDGSIIQHRDGISEDQECRGDILIKELTELHRKHKRVYFLFPAEAVEIRPEVADKSPFGLVVGLCHLCKKVTPFSQILRTDKNNLYCPRCTMEGRKKQPVEVTFWFRLLSREEKMSYEIIVSRKEAEALMGTTPTQFVESKLGALNCWTQLRKEVESRKKLIAVMNTIRGYHYLKLKTPKKGEVMVFYDTETKVVEVKRGC